MPACDVPVITSDLALWNLAVSHFHGAMSMGMLRLPLVQLQQPPVLAQLGGLLLELLELLDGTLLGAAALSQM